MSPGDQPLDVTRFDVESAVQRIHPFVRRTPVVDLEPGVFGLDCALTLKLEMLQHTGSFKPRGAFNRMLTADIDASGVLAASGGNFGLAVAYVAKALGHPAEIFVPATSPTMKIERIRSYGATVHVIDGFYAEAYAACEERAFDTGAAFLHPYDQPAVDVYPMMWQAKMECLTGGNKNVSKHRAQELFPGVRITHAVADALLIAEYGRRRQCPT